MLLDFLSKYLEEIEATVRKVEGAYVERYEEEIVAVHPVKKVPPQAAKFINTNKQ